VTILLTIVRCNVSSSYIIAVTLQCMCIISHVSCSSSYTVVNSYYNGHPCHVHIGMMHRAVPVKRL